MTVSREKKNLVLLAGTLLVALIMRLSLSFLPDTMGDLSQYRHWQERIATVGIVSAYGEESPPYIDYPPVFPYILKALSGLRGVLPASWVPGWGDAGSFMLKLPAVLAELAITCLVFVFVRKGAGFRAAYASALLFAFNPAVLFNTTYWGQADAVHSLFVLCSVVTLAWGKPELSWVFLTVGVLTKPLAAPFVPLVALVTLRDYSRVRFIRCICLAVFTAVVLLVPFVMTGTFSVIVARIIHDIGVMPFVSVNAHNLWWCLTAGPPWVPASNRLLGIVTYKAVGIVAFVVIQSLLIVKVVKHRDRGLLLAVAAAMPLVFFMVSTHMHENHMYGVFPLMAMVCMRSRRATVVYVLLSVTFLANMVLHDEYITGGYLHGVAVDPGAAVGLADAAETAAKMPLVLQRLTVINSVANTLIFAWWMVELAGWMRQRRIPVSGAVGSRCGTG